VEELPGCFASGFSLDELQEALLDAIQLWMPEGVTLGTPQLDVEDQREPNGAASGRRIRVRA
jgi:predicted RNase H-like HicB family nuclease